MSFNDEYQKLRKKRLQQEQKAPSSLLYKSKTATAEDIAPVILSTGNQNDDDDDLLPVRKTREEFQGLSDGYQFGDLSKMFASSVEDFGISMAEGITGLGEGILDAGFYGVAGIADKFGKDGVAEALRKVAQWNTTQTVGDMKRSEQKFSGHSIGEASVLGEKARGFGQGLGQVVGIMATGGLGGVAGLGSAGTTALTTGVMGVSSTGSGMSEAYESGATDEEAATYGLINGVVNAGSELLFGGLGKAVNALGISRGIGSLDDMLAKKLSEKISNHFVKTTIQYGVKASAEGFEEVLAGVGQAVGKKLTYMSDEELGQLIKDENLLEQFAMGAAISGVMQIPDAAGSIKSGNDFITGMSKEQEAAFKDESTVVDSLFKDRVAEQEKDGAKLTGKQKNAIREQLERDLDRGYISVDDIERILGGEAYEGYVNTLNEQKTLQDEYDALYKMKNGEKSDEQIDRQKELKAKLEEITQKDAATTLKTQLSEDVFNRAKNGRLAESYNERARRGQAFEADLSQYDAKQAEIVKKAVESGILNNTNRTHEFVDMVAKISADKGVLFDFVNNSKLKESGFAVEGATVNGYFDKKTNTVGVNIDSAKAFDTVVGHEITHVIEGTELYTELQKAVFDYAKTKGEYDGRREALAKLYAEEDINAEMTADLVGEYLFTDEDFVKSLSVQNRNVFQKIYDEIKYLYKVVTAGSKEARELERVKRAFDKAYKESGKASGTKYSLGYHAGDLGKAESYAQQGGYRDTGHFGTGTYFVGDESKISDGHYGKRPHHAVEFNNYNLYKVRSDKDGYDLHKQLKVIDSGVTQDFLDAVKAEKYRVSELRNEAWERGDKNQKPDVYDEELGFEVPPSDYTDVMIQAFTDVANSNGVEIQTYDEWLAEQSDDVPAQGNPDYDYYKSDYLGYLKDTLDEVDEARNKGYEDFSDAYFRLWLRFGKENVNNALQAVVDYDSVIREASSDDKYRADSRATVFMKALGYEGIDVRGTGLDNTTYGSVIYDLKGEDAQRKAEIGTAKYSLSDSDGKQLTKEQQEYFKDSKMRDDNGNLMVMYHGSQDAGFHVFDAKMSDDDTSFFFVDRNEVATTYSGTTETYEARTIRSADDMNRFLAEIGYDYYKAVEKNGRFELLENNEHVAWSDTAQGIYEEFCWYEGVGDGDANYKVYLNLKNPLVVDGKGRPWNKIDAEFSQEVYDKYQSLTAEEKDALIDLAEWEDFSLFNSEIQEATEGDLASAYAKMGEDCNIYDLFSVAADNFSEESMRENARGYLKTRDYAQRAKEQGYDGVIFNNIVDNGGFSNGSEGASTVAIAFESSQIKSVANENPTGDPDIRYSLSEDSEGRQLTEAQKAKFKGSKVVDENGNLKVVYHGSPAEFYTFSLEYLGTNGTNEGYGFYFTDSKHIADGYSQRGQNPGKLFEVYLDIKKPLSDTKITMSRAQFKKFLTELNKQVDGDGERLDILSNYGDVEWEGLNNVLNYAMELEYDGNDTDVDIVHSIINSCGNMEVVFDVLRKVTGYDGIIVKEAEWGGDQTIYVAFHPEQIKNVDNLNPTDDPDTRYHRSAEGEAPGKGRFYGKDIRLEFAPVAEDVSTTTEQAAPEAVAPVENVAPETDWMPDAEETYAPSLYDLRDERDALREQMIAVQDDLDAVAPLAQRYGEVMQQIQQLEAEESERLASLDDADVPQENEAPYQTDDIIDPFDERDIKAVGDRKVKAYMFEHPEVKPYIQKAASEMLGEVGNSDRGERYYTETPDGRPGVYGAESYGVWSGQARRTTPDIEYLLDKGQNGIDRGYSWGEIVEGLNAIIEDNGKENNACSKRIEILLHQRLMDGYDTFDMQIPANGEYRNLIKAKGWAEQTAEDAKHLDDQYAPLKNNKIEVEPIEDIAPVKEKYEAIRPKQTKEPSMKRVDTKAEKPEGKIAKVLTEEPQTERKGKNAWSMFKNHVLDKGMVFEDLSLKTGNRELQARWNTIRYAESKAQKMIGEGNEGVSSLNSIRQTVESSGKTEQFYEYLYHKHNVDRMSLEAKAAPTIGALRSKFGHLQKKQIQAIAAKEITDKTTERTAQTIREAKEYLNAIETKNKPVFGDDVTADVSKERVAEYEKANPEFKAWARDVYDYMNYLREMLVDDGVISNDTARLWAEMYPNYVPIRRAGKEGPGINVPLDTGRTGVNAPIKRAEGGNSDILPLFDTMALRTQQTYRAIAKNRFGVELKNTLGTTIDNTAQGVDDTIDSIDNHDELLQKGKNGEKPTFTVFENGERVTFEITEEMYDAMKPTSKELAYTNKVLNTAGNVFRGLLTEYNPVFMMTNATKDVQDILINSQHPARTYAAIPKAITQMASGGHWYNEYLKNGGEQNTYFDGDSKTFKAEDEGWKKVVGMPLRTISFLNNTIERVPRVAEYIASREAGQSVDVAMLDAARVTTNFAAGGDLTKALNRNGFTFLNASTQGAVQQVRNIREAKANGLKGWVQLAAKVTAAGLPAMLLNALLWDDDEDYEELSDYVKQNYYVVAKFGDGQFVRIPKGRTVAVIQNAFEQVGNALTGDDEVDLQSFLELSISNLAPNNPLENNILAPIMQVANNETWYGEDLVPTRLQDLPAAEQYDESTDSISRWLGEKLNYSPYKINYLLNQYSGGVGDVVLPMLTPEAESGDNSLVGNIIAPFKDKFTTDSTMNNQNVSDFYDTVDELTKNAKSSNATDEDVLKYKYINSVQSELSELYKQKREIQNSDLSDAEKYDAVRDIQKQINSLASESLETYKGVYINDGYATVGDRHYKLKDGEWQKISDDQLEKQNEVVDGLGIDPSEYWANKSEYDFAYEYPEKYAVAKSVGGYEKYKAYSSELYDIKADKDEDGKSISGSRKEKVIDYINNLDADYGERLILFKNEYNADDTYNEEIIDYLNGREDISYDEMVTILTELGFTVKNGNVYWD